MGELRRWGDSSGVSGSAQTPEIWGVAQVSRRFRSVFRNADPPIFFAHDKHGYRSTGGQVCSDTAEKCLAGTTTATTNRENMHARISGVLEQSARRDSREQDRLRRSVQCRACCLCRSRQRNFGLLLISALPARACGVEIDDRRQRQDTDAVTEQRDR